MRTRSPIFNVPTPVAFLIALLVIVHVARSFLGRDAMIDVLYRFAFIPARYGNSDFYPGGSGADFWSVLSYAFLHADLVHLTINVLWMASFGSALAQRIGGVRFFTLFALGSMAGAGLHFYALPDDTAPLIGASAGVSALMAATLRFAFAPGGPLAGGRGRRDSFYVPAPTLLESLANQRVLAFILLWFAVNLMFGANSFGLVGEGNSIAWQAHIGGFLTGLFLFPLFDPVRVFHDDFTG